MKQMLLVLGMAIALGILPGTVGAHHGGAAFDQSQRVTFTATVTEMQFINPHVLIHFEVKTAEGVEEWSGWLTAPNKLARAGWSRRTLGPGDQITVEGRPHKAGQHILQIQRLVGPDGRELPLFED